MKRRAAEENMTNMVINSIIAIREMHNLMGLKKIYYLLKPDGIGRNRFIEIGMEYGLGIDRIISYQRTTFSCKSHCFRNLTAGMVIRDINQVWVSDITYFRVGERFYYLTFIEDVYSRRILGYTAYRSLEAEANCISLKQALRERKGMNLQGLIHHSDKGTQYISNKYLRILSENGISVSMCDSVYENTHIERLNGIIKNEYLQHKRIETYEELQRELKKAIRLYNEERVHWSLACKTPVEYESSLERVPISERNGLILYSEKPRSYIQERMF
ncbi:MAG: putative transposase [Bacteroidota bacterium]|nr:putative transposase [Bacteroidota bacterium]